MSADNTALDAAIIEAIRSGCVTFSAIQDSVMRAMLPRVVRKFSVIDRRLQALRKRGMITWASKPYGWRLAKTD